jgi:hypothetical protein
MVPQTHLAGAEAEVDFGEFYTWVGGAMVTVWMFVMRLSCSGRAFHIAFGTLSCWSLADMIRRRSWDGLGCGLARACAE